MTYLRSGHLVASLLCCYAVACGSSGGGQNTGGADPVGGAGVADGGDNAGGESSTGGSNDSSSGGAPPSNTTPIFRMDCEDAPLDCGFGHIPDPSPYYTMTHVEDGGPGGEDVVEVVHTPQPVGAGQMQYNLGWWHDMDAPPQGSTRYIRLWLKPITPIAFNGTGDVWTDKFIILGDGAPEDTRVICNLRDDFGIGTGNDMLVNCARNIDGAPSQAGGDTLVPNQWNYLQIEVRSSSASGVEDAHISIWFNSNDYDAPTSQSSGGFALETYGWTNVRLGAYANTLLAHDGSIRYQIGGFELDDELDPHWAP